MKVFLSRILKNSERLCRALPQSGAVLQEDVKLTNPLWKTDETVHLYHAANQHMTRSALAVVTLNSAKPLCYDQVKTAFRIMQKKCLNLRTCLRWYGNDLWICEVLNPDVDFKVLDKNTDTLQAVEDSMAERFDSPDRPHWRVRLIPRSNDSPCVVPGVKAKFPHQYDYIFHPNHIMCDGINIIMCIQFSLIILNAIISGKHDDLKPLGAYTDQDGLCNVEEKIKRIVLEDKCSLDALAGEMHSPDRTLWMSKIFCQPNVSKPFTKHTSRIIQADVLNNIHKRMKEYGVTFNSSFVAVINAVIVDLLKESEISKNSYHISTNHIVNIRRYIQKTKVPMLGSYNYPLSHCSEVSSDVKDNFWDYTQTLHRDLQKLLKSKTVLEQNVCRKLLQPAVSPSQFFHNPPPVTHDYGISNIGDVTTIIPGTGDHVQVTDIVSYNYIHSYIHSVLHQILTYRGHSRYTLSYDTSCLDDISANKIADKVVNLLEEISR